MDIALVPLVHQAIRDHARPAGPQAQTSGDSEEGRGFQVDEQHAQRSEAFNERNSFAIEGIDAEGKADVKRLAVLPKCGGQPFHQSEIGNRGILSRRIVARRAIPAHCPFQQNDVPHVEVGLKRASQPQAKDIRIPACAQLFQGIGDTRAAVGGKMQAKSATRWRQANAQGRRLIRPRNVLLDLGKSREQVTEKAGTERDKARLPQVEC